jgi:uncharacterized membrane protein YfcA
MILSTISGGGTNVILVPALILIFNLSPGNAIGTSFLALTFGSLVATIRFSQMGKVDFRWGLMLSAISIPGVVLGSFLTSFVQGVLFNTLLGITVIVMAAIVFLRTLDLRKKHASAPATPAPDPIDSNSYRVRSKTAILTLLPVGIFIGMFGVGGGLLLMPIMLYIGFPILVALGTMRLIGLAVSFAALMTRLSFAQVNFEFGLGLAIGTIMGGLLGAKVGLTVNTKDLERLASIILIILGLSLVVEGLF